MRLLFLIFIFVVFLHAQRINISNFYYRDYLDFGQNKGIFKENATDNNTFTIIGKDGSTLTIPHISTFQASSNYGSLTSIGRGFVVTANHVTSPEGAEGLLNWGLTKYAIGKEDSNNSIIDSTSKNYGYDTKFSRLTKYIVEGQVEMLDIENSKKENSTNDNLEKFKKQVDEKFKDGDKIYLYQAGSGIVTLQGGKNTETFNTDGTGERRGGGFGTFGSVDYYNDGIAFYYKPQTGFYNNISSGDSGSGIYAYDKDKNEWILLGVVSRDNGAISVVSNMDFKDYQQKFEQKINLVVTESGQNSWTLDNQKIENVVRGDTPKQEHQLQQNKDIIFSGGGNIEVSANIYRNVSGYAGGFVFESSADSNKTTYKFTNKDNQTYIFDGSGLDIGENVLVEWALRNKSGESLHKIGKGELKITTNYTPTQTNGKEENLGYLKIGEGKVVLDTSKKAYDGIYITSGRGELALVNGKAEALGATKNEATSQNQSQNAESYTLAQNKNSEMGFYFGTGGGVLDLTGNNLTLNTIAANDRFAVIKSQNEATLEIQGFGYKNDGTKESTKANTIIHASIGENALDSTATDSTSTNSATSHINLKYSGNNNTTQSTINSSDSSDETKAHLIFDGNINTKGKLEVSNGNIALQGHATAHATISDDSIRQKIQNAESSTSKAMPDYMDLSKPSTLMQPDWDNRSFSTGGIVLDNSNLTLGRNATLESDITANNNSKITFGADVTHFIDNNDGKNITGSGFSYYQKVESGKLSGEALENANESISYKGTITANGGSITSSIFDFRANLDLKQSATLNANYLTIEKSSSIKMESGTSASVKTLKLSNISASDLSSIFKNGTSDSNSSKLKVTEKFWFENTSNFDFSKLESTSGLENCTNCDIKANKSSITGTSKDLNANVELLDNSTLSLKSLTLKHIDSTQNAESTLDSTQSNTEAESTLDSTNIKNRVYLENTSEGDDFTKLNLTESLKAQNLDSANIELRGKSELSAKSIEFSDVKDGKMILDSNAKLTGVNNNNANIEVKGTDSALNIYFDGEKTFDINASGTNTNITLLSLQGSEFSKNNADSAMKSDSAIENNFMATFKGKITANDSSVIASALESITANIDLKGNAKLEAKNITLDSANNSISLNGNSTLTADKIIAKDISAFNLTQDTNANFNVKNITLENSTLKANTLTFNNAESSIITSDDTSKLEITNLKVTSGKLTLDLADSTKNAEKLNAIDISNNANVIFANKWDFGNSTSFTSNNGSGKVRFKGATYTYNGSVKTINANSMIDGELSLLGVGKTQETTSAKSSTQETNNANPSISFEALKFDSKTLEFGSTSTIKITFDDAIKKGASNITLGEYYTLISASEIFDNRSDKRIDFNFANSISESDKLFVVSKIDNDKLQIKFLNDDPKTFGELIKNIDKNYADILGVLIEHNNNDESIDIATRTDDYEVLNARLKSIDSTMQNIAESSNTHFMKNLLVSNNHAIDTRITQVRLASAKKPQYFAYSDTMQRIMKLQDGGIASDAVPSYKVTNAIERPNDVWLNVGGGYFGGNSKMGFGATNIGYDRLMGFDGGDVLVGAMAGFGVSKGSTNGSNISQNAQFYNFGLYTHSIFGANGGIWGGHELQGNLNFSLYNNAIMISGNSAQNSVFGLLTNVYYKYKFVLKSDETTLHSLKPVVLLGFGYNRSGAFNAGEYYSSANNQVQLALGLGVEYNFVQNDSFYSIAFMVQDRVFNTKNDAKITMSGARSFIGYTIAEAPSADFTLNFTGTHHITSGFYIQYSVMGLVDTMVNYGIKGDIKVGYRF